MTTGGNMSWTRTAEDIDPNVEDLLNRIRNGEPEQDVLAGLPAETQKLVKKLMQQFPSPKPDTVERWLDQAPQEHYVIPGGKQWVAWDDANEILSFMTDEEVIQNAIENQEQFPEYGALGTPTTADQAWRVIDEIWEGDPGGRGWHKRIPVGSGWLTISRQEGAVPSVQFNKGKPPKDTKLNQPGY
jgi:hypothetical protein